MSGRILRGCVWGRGCAPWLSSRWLWHSVIPAAVAAGIAPPRQPLVPWCDTGDERRPATSAFLVSHVTCSGPSRGEQKAADGMSVRVVSGNSWSYSDSIGVCGPASVAS